jgi:PIN domain nuclease of toxin-antitoxin system
VNLLLDTCAFLWLAASPERISPAAHRAIDDESNTLYLSDASIWEIALKHALGKLPLPTLPRTWVPAQAAFFQLRRLAIDPQTIYLSAELPSLHRDPFDRLLAAQAQCLAMTVLTPDLPFQQLGAKVTW